jgi:outer membrane biosynthesis protein TonB
MSLRTSRDQFEGWRTEAVPPAEPQPPLVPEPEPVPSDPPGPVIVPEPEPVPSDPPGPVIVPEPGPAPLTPKQAEEHRNQGLLEEPEQESRPLGERLAAFIRSAFSPKR